MFCLLVWFLPHIQAQITISELMYHPSPAVPENTDLEWVEFHNRSTVPVNLEGWRVTKGVSYSFPNVTIPGDGRLVLAANLAAFRQQYPTLSNVVGNWSGKLRNDGESVELVDAEGNVAAAVHYYKEGDWAARRIGTAYPGKPEWWRGWEWFSAANGSGASLELIDESLPAGNGQNWGASKVMGGTPGAINSIATNRSAPLISGVTHYPAVPLPTSQVWITADLIGSEPGEPLDATLFYRPDGASDFLAVPMRDDGLHHDGMAGDGRWGCVLPPHPDKTIVEYYIMSRQAGLGRTWPAPTDELGTQGANALYQVDASVYSGRQPLYRVVITSNDWAGWSHLMNNVSRGAYSDAQMNGTVIRQDETAAEISYLAGIRNRGAGTRSANPHNLHIAFAHDRPLGKVNRLNFNTRTVHSQVAGNAIFSSVNLINAYGEPVQVRVNGRNLANAEPNGSTDSYQFGSYYCFEPYDSGWAATHVPHDPNGNIYKGVWYVDGVRLNRAANLEYLGPDPAAYEQRYSESGPTGDTGPYSKQSNVAEDDWSDLIGLTMALSTNTPDASYVSTVDEVLNIDQWLRFIAVNSLLLNMETTLATGAGDDISMYSGVQDRRFQLLNHDLDTVLGQGDASPSWTRSIFKAADLPVLNRLLKHPDIAPRYFRVLKELADTTFSAPVIGGILDQALGGWVPSEYIRAMKDAAEQRRTNVLSQIPLTFAIGSPARVESGFHVSTNGVAPLVGTANVILTRSVLVNGAPASYTPWQGTWSRSDTPLRPGLNRILVQFMGTDGSEVARTNFNFWFKTDSGGTPAAVIDRDTTWRAADGPYFAGANVQISPGATLTIEPGTTAYFDTAVRLVVADGARLLAQGTETAPIWLGLAPGVNGRWGGIQVHGSLGSPESLIEHAVLRGTQDTAIRVSNGAVRIAHTSFGPGEGSSVVLDSASFFIHDCHFGSPAIQVPLLFGTNGIRSDGRGIVRNCYFAGALDGANTIVFSGGRRARGEPILHFKDNVCASGSGDVLLLAGADAWVEHNQFLHVHRDSGADGAGAIRLTSGGATILRNLVFDCDRAVTVEEDAFAVLMQNTILKTGRLEGLEGGSAVITLVNSTAAGGALLERNIIWQAEALSESYPPAYHSPVFNRNLLSTHWAGPGVSNQVALPRLHRYPTPEETRFTTWSDAQVAWNWVAPSAASPARGEAPPDDLGASCPEGILISTPLASPTSSRSATFTLGPGQIAEVPASIFPNGAGYTHYRWRLDDGPWSEESPVSQVLEMQGLGLGPHRVTVFGRRDSGSMQDAPEFSSTASPSLSPEWTVIPEGPKVRLNEVLAWNEADGPDLVELYNAGDVALDLAGCSLTDTLAEPTRFVFSSGTVIPPGSYLVLYARPGTSDPGNPGFGLDHEGDSLYLVDSPSRGQAVLDRVSFGAQARGYSIGRYPDGSWGLCRPTPGSRNSPQALESMLRLRINEWLAAGAGTLPDDFVEVYNPSEAAIELSGLRISDAPAGSPEGHTVPPLSFIGPKGFVTFIADGGLGPSHLSFGLSRQGGALGIFTPSLAPIDTVVFTSQRPGITEGRAPDGSPAVRVLPLPTPGLPNPVPGVSEPTNRVVEYTLLPFSNAWRFAAWGTAPAPDWVDPTYIDADWPTGQALLGHDPASPSPYPEPIRTELPMVGTNGDQVITYYFRTSFAVETNLTGFTIQARVLVDDGAIFYLNGERIANLRLTNEPARYEDRARNQSNEGRTERFEITPAVLLPGTNLLAVEVHQSSSTSSDVIFGMSLVASRTVPVEAEIRILLNEVLADNQSFPGPDGAVSDWIEIANASSSEADLAGCSLSDNPAEPRRWVFPPGVSLGAGAILLVKCDPSSPPSTNNSGVLNTGFGLNASGDPLLLCDSMGTLLDSVVFGLQTTDLAFGRTTGSLKFTATIPTPGEANVPAAMSPAEMLRLNEWAASVPNGPDWFEIYNPNPLPVALDGLYLTDRLSNSTKHRIAPLSFIGTGVHAYARFIADNQPEQGANHVGFSLDATGETLAIFAENNGAAIDNITFGPQTSGTSEGRYPDGSANVVLFSQPSPGAPNFLLSTNDSDGDGMPDGWESSHGLNPLVDDALLDSDRDGTSNRSEFLAGTDPQDPTSCLRLQVVGANGAEFRLQFTAVAGRSYSLLIKDSLQPSGWRLLHNVSPQPVDTLMVITDTPGDTSRFYRLVTPAGL